VKSSKPDRIVLANWGRRFIAWFVDYMIINVLLVYFGVEQMETNLIPSLLLPRLPGFDISIWSPFSVLAFFLYWTFSEWYFGRSIGQLLLNVRLVDSEGRSASLKASAIQCREISLPAFRLPSRMVLRALQTDEAAILQQTF
jgi:uncharacterized RDD family membrane protein YckC